MPSLSSLPPPESGAFLAKFANTRIIPGATLQAGVAKESVGYITKGCREFTIFALSDQAGSMQPQIRLFDGQWVDLGSAVAVTANTLSITTFEHTAPEVRVVYTPSTTGVVNVQVLCSPDLRY